MLQKIFLYVKNWYNIESDFQIVFAYTKGGKNMENDAFNGIVALKNEYAAAIKEALNLCDDISILDFILKLLQKIIYK